MHARVNAMFPCSTDTEFANVLVLFGFIVLLHVGSTCYNLLSAGGVGKLKCLCVSLRGLWSMSVPAEFQTLLPMLFHEKRQSWMASERSARNGFAFFVTSCMLFSRIRTCVRKHVTFEHDVIIILGNLVILLDKVVGLHTHLYFSLSMITQTLLYVPLWASMGEYLTLLPLLSLFRLRESAIILDPPFAIAWNTLHLGIALWHASSQGSKSGLLVLREIVFFAVIVHACITLKVATTTEILHKLEVKRAKAGQSAAHALLDHVCDVIVELDRDLTLVDDAPKLAAVLLASSQRCVKGTCFTSFLTRKEDKDYLTRTLHGYHDMDRPRADVFHASMRDCNGLNLKMEVFSVTFCNAADESHLLVGIREYSDLGLLQKETSSIAEPGSMADEFCGGISDASDTQQDNAQRDAFVTRTSGNSGTTTKVGASKRKSRSSRTISVNGTNTNMNICHLGQLIQPDRKETSEEARGLSLVMAFGSWNCRLPSQTCCTLHALAAGARSMLSAIIALPCGTCPLPDFEYQCGDCGIGLAAALTSRSCDICRCLKKYSGEPSNQQRRQSDVAVMLGKTEL
eukprot:TRINITY_DN10482_c0_g1_i2.p1 TRINITY_DN10482_c0_g1~~TRINITY_DN10482_c0_g1_i2.p1  ORF type:complete len:570 (+),score=65.06 TRINITY_DN10482_c0_g1_i2:98-1807(+)